MAIPTATPFKPNRGIPQTPRRPPSRTSSIGDTGSISSSSSLSSMPQPPGSVSRYPLRSGAQTPLSKKFKAPLSLESRVRNTSKKPAALSIPRPETPKRSPAASRSRSTTPLPPGSPHTPRTPRTPKKRGDDELNIESEWDVSRVDPERALVDAENVDIDISAEVDEALLKQMDYGSKDQVLVSIRVRPTTQPEAWSINTVQHSLKLHQAYSKASNTPPQEFNFDEVLTGSENRPVYNATAKSHVKAAMEGYNAVIFAYGQTASGKTFTLTGDEEQPGIIPRALKDIFSHIRKTASREYLLRCSYLEIYNEAIHDLLCPPSSSLNHAPVTIQGSGPTLFLTPLREEVVTSLKGVKAVLARGYANRRTATTDWNERSSRSHSVFRVVIESRERGSGGADDGDESNGRATPAVPPTPGGSRLQARGGRTVQTSVLSLIDLAGSEKATSDKDRTREGKYINTSLLTLGSVIGTLAENAAKGKSDHIPYRNSKLTRLLQPSLSGNARISVICTINPDTNAIAESTSTLLFAQRIKRVQLNAQKKEVVDTEALLERYRTEIMDLKQRLAEREAQAPVINRRLSAREQLDESRATNDLNTRIQQLTKLILTSQTVDENKGDDSRPSSPSKLDFDLSPYQLQQELLSARRETESQANQILSLEAALLARPTIPADAPDFEKDKLIVEQTKTIRELEIAIKGYEENLGEPLRAVREDVEKEWVGKVEEERRKRKEKEAWADELVRQLDKEKKLRQKLEEERHALAAFVSHFDTVGLSGATIASKLRHTAGIPALSNATNTNNSIVASTPFSQRRKPFTLPLASVPEQSSPSPMKLSLPLADTLNNSSMNGMTSFIGTIADETMDFDLDADEVSFELFVEKSMRVDPSLVARGASPVRNVFGNKENMPV